MAPAVDQTPDAVAGVLARDQGRSFPRVRWPREVLAVELVRWTARRRCCPGVAPDGPTISPVAASARCSHLRDAWNHVHAAGDESRASSVTASSSPCRVVRRRGGETDGGAARDAGLDSSRARGAAGGALCLDCRAPSRARDDPRRRGARVVMRRRRPAPPISASFAWPSKTAADLRTHAIGEHLCSAATISTWRWPPSSSRS